MALLHLVRVAVKRRDTAAARADLHEAIACARSIGNIAMQLDAVFCFAEIVAADGQIRRAAGLMRYFIERPEVEPGDRAVAQACLEKLHAGSGAPIDLPLDVLLDQVRAETAPAAPCSTGEPPQV
jgi:hypothetical protein